MTVNVVYYVLLLPGEIINLPVHSSKLHLYYLIPTHTEWGQADGAENWNKFRMIKFRLLNV